MSPSEMLIDTRCAYCNEQNGRLVMRTGDPYLDRPNTFDVVACENCGLVRTKQLPRELSRWYEEHYSKAQRIFQHSERATKATLTYQLLDRLAITTMVRKFNLNHHRFIASQIPATGKVLEVGCGTGEILRLLKERGAKVFGVEPHPDSAEVARRHGIQVLCDKAESLENLGEVFDTILFSFAIEHTQDPLTALKLARQVLTCRGKLFVFTHNFNCLSRYIFGQNWSGWHLPYHTYLFTKDTLHRMLTSAGFCVMSIRSYTRPDLLVESCRILLARLRGADAVTFAQNAHLVSMLMFSLVTKPFCLMGLGNALKAVAVPNTVARRSSLGSRVTGDESLTSGLR